ncbi:flavoprotein [Stackebrandtia soli]|uniref:flavoprotein n=1 Tax=Stackebrandtia soli TaxID=1892856 RepID=UPI0039ED4CC5
MSATACRPTLTLVTCGSILTGEVVPALLEPLTRDWDVWVVASPDGARFLDIAEAERLTGHPVHTRYRHPKAPGDVPRTDAIAVVPATCNTVNKWAAGISDTLALGLLTEAIGRGCPILAVPYSNRSHAAHPTFVHNVGLLRGWGVRVLLGDDFFPLPQPKQPEARVGFPWPVVAAEIAGLDPVRSRE